MLLAAVLSAAAPMDDCAATATEMVKLNLRSDIEAYLYDWRPRLGLNCDVVLMFKVFVWFVGDGFAIDLCRCCCKKYGKGSQKVYFLTKFGKGWYYGIKSSIVDCVYQILCLILYNIMCVRWNPVFFSVWLWNSQNNFSRRKPKQKSYNSFVDAISLKWDSEFLFGFSVGQNHEFIPAKPWLLGHAPHTPRTWKTEFSTLRHSPAQVKHKNPGLIRWGITL